MPRRKAPVIADAVLDQLLAGADARTAFDPDGLIDQLKKALAERALNAEMDHHLAGDEAGNSRKTVSTETGRLDLEVPRDRQSTFDPVLVAKHQRRFPGFDDKIISMYARGMSTREIAGHLRDLYGIDVSADLISAVTDAVLDEIATWQARPLESTYPLVFFDALRVKVRDEGVVRNKAVHIAFGVRGDGTKEILGLWLEAERGRQVLAPRHERAQEPRRRACGRHGDADRDGQAQRHRSTSLARRRPRLHRRHPAVQTARAAAVELAAPWRRDRTSGCLIRTRRSRGPRRMLTVAQPGYGDLSARRHGGQVYHQPTRPGVWGAGQAANHVYDFSVCWSVACYVRATSSFDEHKFELLRQIS